MFGLFASRVAQYGSEEPVSAPEQSPGGGTPRRRGLLTLLGVGLLSEAIYLVLYVRPYFLPAEYARLPMVDLGKITAYSPRGFATFVIGMAVLLGLYFVAGRAAAQSIGRWAVLAVFGLGALMAGTLALMYPVSAIDLFDYVFHARILTYHHQNPLVLTPNSFPNDPMLAYVGWRDLPATYGPVWVYLSAVPSLIAGNSLLASLLAFKALVIALYLLDGWLIWQILGRLEGISRTPNRRLAGTLFFLWNPLVLWEVAGNGHNDVLMVAFALLALLCFVQDRWVLVVPVLMLAALSKFVMVVLMPVFLLALARQFPTWQERVRIGLAALALCTVLAVGLYAPLWQGPASLGFVHRTGLFTSSVPALVLAWLYQHGQTELGLPIASAIAFVPFGVFYIWQLRRLLGPHGMAPAREEVLAAAFRVVFVYLSVASVWFMPWYVVWLLALAPTAGRPALRAAAVFGAFALLSYAIYVFVWVWNWDQIDLLGIYTIAVPFVFLPSVAVFLRDLWQVKSSPDLGYPSLS